MKIQIEVSEKQLVQIESIVKQMNQEVVSVDPAKFLKAMFETEMKDLNRYIQDTCFDGGGNSIGDILSQEQIDDMMILDESEDDE